MGLKGRLRNRIATGLLLCTLLALLPAKKALADTLMEALSKAYQGNPNLAAQQANLRAIDESLPQAYAERRPTITGQADYGVQPQKTNIRGTGQSSGTSRGVLPPTRTRATIRPSIPTAPASA